MVLRNVGNLPQRYTALQHIRPGDEYRTDNLMLISVTIRSHTNSVSTETSAGTPTGCIRCFSSFALCPTNRLCDSPSRLSNGYPGYSNALNVVIEWLAFLLRIWEVSGSNFGQVTDYPDRKLLVRLLSLPRQMIGHNRFLPHSFQ
jgi:hypothetical protein